MAVTLEEFDIKLKSDIDATAKRDVAALQRLDSQVATAQKTLAGLGAAADKAGRARIAAEARVASAARQVAEAGSGFGGKVDVGKMRAAQAALAKAQSGLDGSKEAETSARSRLAAQKKEIEALQATRPKIEQLAAASLKAKEASVARSKEEAKASTEKAKSDAKAATETRRWAAEQTRNLRKSDAEAKSDRKRAAAEQARAAKTAAKELVKNQTEAAKAMGSGIQAAGGPLAGFVQKFDALVGLGGAGVLGAMAVGFATLAVAIGIAYGSLTLFGLGAAGAAREARILGEALTGSAALGSEFTAIVNQLARQVPLAKDKIAAMAQSLSLLRLGRRDLQAGLTAIAITTSALGDSAGQAVQAIVTASAAARRFSLGTRDIYGELTGLAGTGLKKADVLGALAKQLNMSVPAVEQALLAGRITLAQGMKALEAAAQARFGKTIAAQMLSFDIQVQKAKESLAGMFSGIDIDPALKGLKEFLSVLDTSTVTGRALKTVLTLGLQGTADALGGLAKLGKPVFQGMIIAALQVYLALRPIGRAIADVTGWFGKLGAGSAAIWVGKVAVYALAIGFGILALAAGAIVGVVYLVIAAVMALVAAVGGAWDWLTSSGATVATALIDGLVAGITSGAASVIASVTALASSAAAAMKAALGIASPSKLFASYGRFTAEGFAGGVEQETPGAQAAVVGLGDAVPAMPGAGGGAARGGGPGTIVYLTMGDVYFGGQKAAGDEKQRLLSWLIEQVTMAINAGGAGQPAEVT